ncbi:hypothetical protein GN956_G18054 [Arapaima gigas]
MVHFLAGGTREARLMDMPLEEEPVKMHLRASQQLLVEALYNIAPLLDCMLAINLLSQDNYYQVRAEKTPMDRARRLLEVVHAQMGEQEALTFLDCLRKCENHYPRLRKWLHAKIGKHTHYTAHVCKILTTRLRAQFSMLCHRLGVSVLPVSHQLFSERTLTQLELDQIESLPTSYQQTQRLLSTCLSKGETACQCFYLALHEEDTYLASEVNASCAAKDETKCQIPVAVEETSGEALLDHHHTGELVKVKERLGAALGKGMTLNVCELGVALGLQRDVVRECLLEGGNIDNVAQLDALVTLFLAKTQDSPRLLRKLEECDLQRVQVSQRGRLLLELLGEADHLLLAGHIHPKVVHILKFLLWDTLSEAVEEPQAQPWEGVVETVQQLRAGGRVEPDLLSELEECWDEEPTVEGLQQGARALALLIQDLYLQQDSLLLSPAYQKGVMGVCRPRKLHRVTLFQGLPGRVISRTLGSLPPPSDPLQRQYRGICLAVARLLERLSPTEGGFAHLANAATPRITQHVRNMLDRPAFGPAAFDSGVRHRLLSMLEFDPVTLDLPSLLRLHHDSLVALESYLRPSECHAFQLYPDRLLVLGDGTELYWAESIMGPVAIDNGMEEVFRFLTSGPTSVLMRICCHGYRNGEKFQVCEPHCVKLAELGDGGTAELHSMGLQVLGADSGTFWVRVAGSMGELLALAQKHGGQAQEAGCCFLLRTPGPQCEVKFFCKQGKIMATAKSNCEVV